MVARARSMPRPRWSRQTYDALAYLALSGAVLSRHGSISDRPWRWNHAARHRRTPTTGCSSSPLHHRASQYIICGRNTLSMLYGNATYRVKLSGEDLSRYSIKIESAGFRKWTYYRCLILLTKWRRNNKHFSELASHHHVFKVAVEIVCTVNSWVCLAYPGWEVRTPKQWRTHTLNYRKRPSPSKI